MGSASSKFKKYLHHGDEYAAMQVFQSAPELQRNLNPNTSYGDHHNHDTALHFAAKHGMKHLLRTFLSDLGGNPNKKNASNQTSLHSACQLTNNKSCSGMERRAACVMFILQWRGDVIEPGGREAIDLTAQDQNGNTALHLAAASGLEQCVQALLAAGSPLFTENNDKLTPCDMAVKNNHVTIAELLESRMVFDDPMDLHNEEELSRVGSEPEEVYCGLRTQDLQEAKDQLLVETCDMLQVPLFTAEALLRDNEWSRELLLEQWMKDAVACCQLAGVEPPASATLQAPSQGDVTLDSLTVTDIEELDVVCDICILPMSEPCVKISCNHKFCSTCWCTYLSSKISEGMSHDIVCPGYQCHILVPNDVIEKMVSPELARRYLQFDIKAFVESNRSFKWCPVAGCARAVRLPEAEQVQPTDFLRNLPNRKPAPLTSHSVDCGNGHFFCWECLGEGHAPSGCQEWRQWLDKVNQVRPEQLNSDRKDLEDASNCLWLVTNSKPCPNCSSPIQKNEGCNHIKCSKCRFDFCWVCLEAWKKHSSATGGYFRCNRFDAASKADEKQAALINEAASRSQHIQDLNRFLHYYTRFKNHENSRRMEEALLTAAKHKMDVLASSLVGAKEIISEKEMNCTKFIEDGVCELLKARRVLCGSYVHGFYLQDEGYNKAIFEFMQNELESVVEKLSEMIARPYLKTPRHVIMQTTCMTRRKRHELVRAVSKGLIPPDSPPTVRVRGRKVPGLLLMDHAIDEEVSSMIVSGLKSLDSNNPWVKDAQGRHNNLAAVNEWPVAEGDCGEENRVLAVSLFGECAREGCNRPRAKNPHTRAIHEHCSLRCARGSALLARHSIMHDESMNLMIALEMSLLEMIQDSVKRENEKPQTAVSVTQTHHDSDLSKAIELSLKEGHAGGAVETDKGQGDSECADKAGQTAHNWTQCRLDWYRANEDFAVDYFLKSLAGQNMHTVQQDSVNLFTGDTEKNFNEKESIIFKPHRTEDGRFEIGDLHEACFTEEDSDAQSLRRVRSTGDLASNNRKKKGFYREESRYHLDSDHSSQHDEKAEDIAKRILACPGNVAKLKEAGTRGIGVDGSTQCAESSVEVEDADLEVCSILSAHQADSCDFVAPGSTTPLTGSFHMRTNACADQLGVRVRAGTLEQTVDELKNSVAKEHLKQLSAKKMRKADDKAAAVAAVTSHTDQPNKSDSVRHLIQEVRDTLKCIEKDTLSSRKALELHGDASEFLRLCPERASTGKIKKSPLGALQNTRYNTKSITTLESLKDHEKQLGAGPGVRTDSRTMLFVGSEKSLNEAHKKAFKAAGGKIIHKREGIGGGTGRLNNPNLRIRIAKSPVVTDSSNEYETETGIPKSPTLFISGVSISRTPEPRPPDKNSPEHQPRSTKISPVLKTLSSLQAHNSSPVLNFTPASVELDEGLSFSAIPPDAFNDKLLNCGRQSRSSSLTVPKTTHTETARARNLNVSCGAILAPHCDNAHNETKRGLNVPVGAILARRKGSCHVVGQTSPRNSVTNLGVENTAFSSGACKRAAVEPEPQINPESLVKEDGSKGDLKKAGKSKSASEPEREREVFRFPKSSTDGALSSVLHVQESNLSSDDFHEVLFLLERSPKHGSKRKKRSKKERDKAKENAGKEDSIEASSAL